MAKKMTFGIALLGVLGGAGLAYSLLRRPRYLYDGKVQVCEGSEPLYGIDQKCTEIAMTRDVGTGKIFAPFSGKVESITEYVEGNRPARPLLTIVSDTKPVAFKFILDGGAAIAQAGKSFKSGDLIAQAERVQVSAERRESTGNMPMPPSAWLAANAFVPSRIKGDNWCEDPYQQIVPRCAGITFRAPELPRWSLRTVRMTLS